MSLVSCTQLLQTLHMCVFYSCISLSHRLLVLCLFVPLDIEQYVLFNSIGVRTWLYYFVLFIVTNHYCLVEEGIRLFNQLIIVYRKSDAIWSHKVGSLQSTTHILRLIYWRFAHIGRCYRKASRACLFYCTSIDIWTPIPYNGLYMSSRDAMYLLPIRHKGFTKK